MTTAPPPAQAVSVPLRDVERELSRQLKVLQGPGHEPVQQARMANLVIFCSSREQAAHIETELPEITRVHPARVLLLVGEQGQPAREVTATVQVRPVLMGQHCTCSEQVTLDAAGPAVDRLPFAVRALLIGDLPTNLWWAAPQPPPLAGPLLYGLGENAQQIMYDSLGWHDPARGVAATASWLEQVERPDVSGRWRVASDLNWRRLKYWRRLVTQALDPASAPGAARSVGEVLVEHGPHAVVQAWELASWLTRRLGWQVLSSRVDPGVELSWRFQTADNGPARVRIRRLEEEPPEVRHVRISCKLGEKPCALDMTVEGPERLALRPEGVPGAARTLALPAHSAAEVVGRQLSDRERDPVFRESMGVAQVMARSVLSH